MGYLIQILLALGALGLAESGFALETRWPFLAASLILVPQILGWQARRDLVAGRFRRGSILDSLLAASPPALYLLALSGFGWHLSVRDWTGSSGSLFGWPDFGVFTVLTPYILIQMSAIDARARVHAGNEISRKVQRGLQTRMFLAALAPAALYMLFSSLVGLVEWARVSVEEIALVGSAYSFLILAGLALVLPRVLRNTWQTESFPDGLHRDLLQRVASLAGFRCRELLVWKTGNSMVNAAIVGVSANSRFVLFSDALLQQLELRELAAVFAHEIGHAVRRHVPVFIAWTVAYFLALGFVEEWFGLEEGATPFALLAGGLFLGYWGFGYMSRRFELDADLYAIELLGDPEAMIRALEQIGGRLRDVAGWRHFSVSDRVVFLRRATQDPRVGKRLKRTVRGFALAAYVFLTLMLIAEVLSLSSSWHRDRLNVDLRLGRYAEARLAAEQLQDPHSADLAALAVALVDSGRVANFSSLDASQFESFARGALLEDNAELAMDYLELAVWRGAEALVPVWQWLDHGARDELGARRELEAQLPEGWLGLLEAL